MFPSEYLQIIRNIDINLLEDREPKVKLRHTKRYNLLMTDDRTEFIKEFVALLRFIAAGEANVGHLRKDGVVIHRTVAESVEEVVLHPPQQAMDELEEEKWRLLEAWRYED